MSIKIFNTLFVTFLISILTFSHSYADEWSFLSTWETIKELKENIEQLNKVNSELINDLTELNTDYKLKTFLRTDLSKQEFSDIKDVVWEYNENNSVIESELLLNAKKQNSVISERKKLLEEKRKFYSWLIPYINTKYKAEFLEYIRRDATIFKKQNIVSTDIIVKKEILDTKVTKIESEILKHKEYIKDSIKNIIESRLDLKIKNLNTNKSFNDLNVDSKIKVIDKTISKVKIKLQKLENTRWISWTWDLINSNDLSVLENKIQTYNIAVNKLEWFKQTILK